MHYYDIVSAMLRVARAIEHSLSSTITPQLEKERVEKIKTLRAFPDRMGAMALHHIIAAHPNAARKAINLFLYPLSMSYLSSGADSGVFRRGNEVVKVIRSTVPLSEGEKHTVAQQRESRYQELASFLGEFLLEEETVVDSHPLNPEWRVVQTRQPFCGHLSLDLFQLDYPEVNLDAVVQLNQEHPGIDSGLSDFIEVSRRYHERTSLYPDINGTDNLVLAKGPSADLVLLDTGPISTSHPAVQALIEEQLSSLEAALQVIH